MGSKYDLKMKNVWEIADREFYANKAKELNILSDYYADALLEDMIPKTTYDAIVDTVKFLIDMYEYNRNSTALFIAREVAEKAEKSDDINISDLRIEIDVLVDIDKKLRFLERLLTFLNAFQKI